MDNRVEDKNLNDVYEIKIPTAYDGNEPYIFVSYSHEDKDIVYTIIKKFQESGYRVWFDEGIKHGNDWRAYIENRISFCECFVAMISKNFLDSKWCPRELKYADENNKKISCIYLENMEIPKGIGIGIVVSDAQATKKYEYDDENAFYNKIVSWDEIEKCRNNSIDIFENIFELKKKIVKAVLCVDENKLYPLHIIEGAIYELAKLLEYLQENEFYELNVRNRTDFEKFKSFTDEYLRRKGDTDVNNMDIITVRDNENILRLNYELYKTALELLIIYFNTKESS